jgi:glycosyltransferase involved in cell wall biosynthesis
MKAVTPTNVQKTKDADTVQSPMQVCMHVRGAARTDVRVMREATALEKAGFAVSIVDIESESTRPAEEDIGGIHLKHLLRPDWLISARSKPWRLIKTIHKLIVSTLWLLRTPADIYHAHDVNALPPCYIAAQLHRKPLVLDAHEMPLHELEGMRRRWVRTLITQLLAVMIRRCAGVITVSPLIVEEMFNRYHISDISLIRNTLPYHVAPRSNQLRQYLCLSSNVRIVLYSGNLQPDRALDKLIRAARFLERDIVIVLMGRGIGSTRAELEALIAREMVADRVKIIPPVSYEELLDWTSSADIGAIAYAPDYSINARVQFPNKLFEYLMAGLPVLASQLPAIAEIIETYDVGHVLTSLEPADIGSEINAMLADHDGLERMQHNALLATRHDLNWEKESQVLLRLYHDILYKQNKGHSGQESFPHQSSISSLEGEHNAHSLH